MLKFKLTLIQVPKLFWRRPNLSIKTPWHLFNIVLPLLSTLNKSSASIYFPIYNSRICLVASSAKNMFKRISEGRFQINILRENHSFPVPFYLCNFPISHKNIWGHFSYLPNFLATLKQKTIFGPNIRKNIFAILFSVNHVMNKYV